MSQTAKEVNQTDSAASSPSREDERFVLQRMIHSLEDTCRKSSRMMTLQVALVAGGLGLSGYGESYSSIIFLGVTIPGPLIEVFIFGMLLKLHLDWGYLSFRYLTVRRQVDEQCKRFFQRWPNAEDAFSPSSYHFTIPPSFFETLYAMRDLNQGHSKQKRPKSYFVVYFLGSLFPVAILGASWAVIFDIGHHHISLSSSWGPLAGNVLPTSLAMAIGVFSFGHYILQARDLPVGPSDKISDRRWFTYAVVVIFTLLLAFAISVYLTFNHDHSVTAGQSAGTADNAVLANDARQLRSAT
ncbi:MAG: hypothetical protein U5O39_10215 [Gammaproteobacteria bacterium]|nr:hypothetical protein [Gammaproteobacteria bacterium]